MKNRAIERVITALFAVSILAGMTMIENLPASLAKHQVSTAWPGEDDGFAQYARLEIELPKAEYKMAFVSEVEDTVLGLARIDADRLNHRACASTECEIVSQSTRGAVRQIYEVKQGWIRISPATAAKEIWVSADYITPVDERGNVVQMAELHTLSADHA